MGYSLAQGFRRFFTVSHGSLAGVNFSFFVMYFLIQPALEGLEIWQRLGKQSKQEGAMPIQEDMLRLSVLIRRFLKRSIPSL